MRRKLLYPVDVSRHLGRDFLYGPGDALWAGESVPGSKGKVRPDIIVFNPKNGLYTVIEVIDTNVYDSWGKRVRRIEGAFGPNASVSVERLDRGNKDAVFKRLGIGKRRGR